MSSSLSPEQDPFGQTKGQSSSAATSGEKNEKKVYLETFGCQMNVADSEIVLERLAADGYAPTETSDDADLVLYNTCSVRDKAEAKVRGRLGNLKKRKTKTPRSAHRHHGLHGPA